MTLYTAFLNGQNSKGIERVLNIEILVKFGFEGVSSVWFVGKKGFFMFVLWLVLFFRGFPGLLYLLCGFVLGGLLCLL